MRGYGVQTNRFTFGAYRGPGAPTAAFAVETLIDELAAKLELDPLELRRKNALVEGDQGVTGPVPTFGAVEVIEASAAHELWAKRDSLPEDEGIGVAVGYWPGGNEPAAAVCRVEHRRHDDRRHVGGRHDGREHRLRDDRRRRLRPARPRRCSVVMADTSTGPVRRRERRLEGDVHGRARQSSGRPRRRARSCWQPPRRSWRSRPATSRSWTASSAPWARPTARSPSRTSRRRRCASAAATSRSRATAARRRRAWRPSVAAHIAHVKVDRETGEVELLGYAIVQDVGRALNPALVEGQMRGGAAQAIGWALYEELVHDEDGRLLSGSFLDYAIPTADRVPPIDTVIVEVPAPDGPFGAKGIGEAPVIPGPAAIANADPRRDRRAPARAADDAPARLGSAQRRAVIGAVVLAAGEASRFGSPKQQLMLADVLRAVRASSVDEIVVVDGRVRAGDGRARRALRRVAARDGSVSALRPRGAAGRDRGGRSSSSPTARTSRRRRSTASSRPGEKAAETSSPRATAACAATPCCSRGQPGTTFPTRAPARSTPRSSPATTSVIPGDVDYPEDLRPSGSLSATSFAFSSGDISSRHAVFT